MTTESQVNDALLSIEGVELTENSLSLGGILAVVHEEAIGQFYRAVRENGFEHDGSRLNENTLVVKIAVDQIDQVLEEVSDRENETPIAQ